MKRVAIIQSNYIPWKGYFDLIASVDEFVLYDTVQYTRRDWRNRNLIKTASGLQWLSVPVKVRGRYHQSIAETEIMGNEWASQHWRTITSNYRRSSFFDDVRQWLEPVYTEEHFTHLSALNHRLIRSVCSYLGIGTRIHSSSEFMVSEERSERLAEICQKIQAGVYVSGPAAKSYLNEQLFTDRGISVSWFDYGHYPEYPQLWGSFEHGVSILDLLFNCGKSAPSFMKWVQR